MEALEQRHQAAKLVPDVELWLKVAREHGFHDFLSADDGFSRSTISGRPWGNQARAGIYLWLASDGAAYVGQSVRPRSRLRQHMRAHDDIMLAAFQRCPRKELDALEQKLVEAIGRHFPLRNIKFAVSTANTVPFDEVVTPAEQEAFLAGADFTAGEWQPLDDLGRLQAKKFERFLTDPNSDIAIELVRLFVSRAIPKPDATELSFWSLSIFPDKGFVRVNAGQQEVFTFETRTNRVRLFSDTSLSLVRSWRSPYEVPSWVNFLRPHHLYLWLSAQRLLSCRRLVLRLMRHTQALNSASHCPQLLRDPVSGG